MSGRATALDETVAAFRKWLHLPDPAALYAVLGAVAANRLPGDPVWLLLVGSPSSGKSEILQAVGSLADVHPAASLTEGGLLSGTPKREAAPGASGGLLRQIGSYGIVLAKDFGSVLSMHHDTRTQVLAALREVYDGSWTRSLGTDGGKTLHWEGKVGLIAGCTPTIDRHHAVMGAMGERFVLLRLSPSDAHDQGRKALAHRKHSEAMRTELAAAVVELFDHPIEPPKRSDADADRLVSLAVLTVRCRSAVERDGHTREVELIPEPEAPARLVIVLDRLLDGLFAIGADPHTAWSVVEAAALDSIPAVRREAMTALLDGNGDGLTLSTIATAIGYPRKTTERALEDLVAHGIAAVDRRGSGTATVWRATDWTTASWAAATLPEKSQGSYIEPRTHTDDFSGEVGSTANGNSNGHGDADGWSVQELEAAAASFEAEQAERGEAP